MNRQFPFFILLMILFLSIQIHYVSSEEIVVGVKIGDWIEYKVTTTGEVPQEHDLKKARIEVIKVDGNEILINITSIFKDSRKQTTQATLNLETGEILDSFIIPANLNSGDSFSEKVQGTITINESIQKLVIGVNRTLNTASTSSTIFYWDKQTGFLIEAISTYKEFSILTVAQTTNLWQKQNNLTDMIGTALIIILAIGLSSIIIKIIISKTKDQKSLPGK